MKNKLSIFIVSYLKFLAKISLNKHSTYIIGIAGSVGKSSTTNALHAILKDHFPTKTVGNSETGIPLGILGLKPTDYSILDWIVLIIKAPFGINYLKGTKYLIVEMGIDDPYPPKNMEYLLSIIKPNTAIVLNESATHSEQFEKSLSSEERNLPDNKKLDAVIQKISDEDCKIITKSNCNLAIYNADSDYITKSLKDFKNSSTRLLSFGQYYTNNISFVNYSVNLKGTRFTLKLNGKSVNLEFKNIILPQAYFYVFAPAILTTNEFGINLNQIKKSLEKNFKLPKGRSSIFSGIKNSVIIDSTYNSSKSSVFTFLDLMEKLKSQNPNSPIVIILGDMRELGSESQIEHREVGEELVGIADYLYLIGPQTLEFIMPISQENITRFKEVRWFKNYKHANNFIPKNLPENSIVLAKGSQNTIYLEEVIKQLLENKKDIKNLCRQDRFFMNQKNYMLKKDKIDS